MLGNEEISALNNALGIEGYSFQQDFEIYYNSAVQHYKSLSASYVKRNLPFLMDSLFVTLSHSTNPQKNPSGFGLSLGSFTGILSKCTDADTFKMMLGNEQAHNFLVKILEQFKKVSGFDVAILQKEFASVNFSGLSDAEKERFSRIVEMLV